MGRPKSRQAPRTTMSIRVSERERRQIEEKVQERESRSEAMSAGEGGVY